MVNLPPKGARDFAEDVLKEVRKKMFGLDEVVRFCLIALYTDGHVLLEGNPGLGKTALVKTLGKVLGLDNKRIQFTPDLMPSDITGTFLPEISDGVANMQTLKFRKGPVFTSLLLADEINRATPKTQSAMLEVMAEYQVTVLGDTYRLEKPFLVLATQNPIEHHLGTYDLPEAQLDRFMFKIDMPTPDVNTLSGIVNKETGPTGTEVVTLSSIPVHKDLSRSIKNVEPRLAIQQHIYNIVQASNRRYSDLANLSAGQENHIRSMVDCFRYELGPRAAIALMNGAKAWSLFFSPDVDRRTHMQSLARVAIPVLRHRVKPKYGWEQEYQRSKPYQWPGGGKEEVDFESMLADFCLATAPTQDEYHKEVKNFFDRFFDDKKR